MVRPVTDPLLARERRAQKHLRAFGDDCRCEVCGEDDPDAIPTESHDVGGHQPGAMKVCACKNDHGALNVRQAPYLHLLELVKLPTCPWQIRSIVRDFDVEALLDRLIKHLEREAFQDEERGRPPNEIAQAREDIADLRRIAQRVGSRGQALVDRHKLTRRGRELLERPAPHRRGSR